MSEDRKLEQRRRARGKGNLQQWQELKQQFLSWGLLRNVALGHIWIGAV